MQFCGRAGLKVRVLSQYVYGHEYMVCLIPEGQDNCLFDCCQQIRAFTSSCLIFPNIPFCKFEILGAESGFSYRWPCEVPASSLGIMPECVYQEKEMLPRESDKTNLNKPVDSVLGQLQLWAALHIFYLGKSM